VGLIDKLILRAVKAAGFTGLALGLLGGVAAEESKIKSTKEEIKPLESPSKAKVTRAEQDKINELMAAIQKKNQGKERFLPYFSKKQHLLPDTIKQKPEPNHHFELPLLYGHLNIQMPLNWFIGHYQFKTPDSSSQFYTQFIPGFDRFTPDNIGLSFYTPNAFVHLYSNGPRPIAHSFFKHDFYSDYDLDKITRAMNCEDDIFCDITDELSKIDLFWLQKSWPLGRGATRMGTAHILQTVPIQNKRPVVKFEDLNEPGAQSQHAYTVHISSTAIHIQSLDDNPLTAEDIKGALQHFELSFVKSKN